jgi:putative oxidoreductase
MPLTIGAAQFWLMRKGFYFTAAGCELPVVWTIMLIVQAMLGDGPYAVKMPALPWVQSRQTYAA